MKLTPLGAQAAQLGAPERKKLGLSITKGEKNIDKYAPGVCYEAAAFVRFLLGEKITPHDLTSVVGLAWIDKLKFDKSKPWDGKTTIPVGTAVGFLRLNDKKIFHVGICSATGKIRAVNGHLLGMGWHEVELKKVLGVPNAKHEFTYDNAQIQVLRGTV